MTNVEQHLLRLDADGRIEVVRLPLGRAVQDAPSTKLQDAMTVVGLPRAKAALGVG